MKNNQPVTDNEVVMKDGEFLVSTTDMKGCITSANEAFIEISGFTKAELIGKSHNIVRHPDMPPVAFQDLWDTIKADKPWSGAVKNRCKNGDYYWVNANVTPVRENGKTTGYMSLRTRPTREEISAADDLYSRINAGTASFPSTSKSGLGGRLRKISVKAYVPDFCSYDPDAGGGCRLFGLFGNQCIDTVGPIGGHSGSIVCLWPVFQPLHHTTD